MALSALVRWNKRIEPKLIRNKRATKIDSEDLKRDVAKHPDAYHYERARTFHVSKSCTQYALKRLNIRALLLKYRTYRVTFLHKQPHRKFEHFACLRNRAKKMPEQAMIDFDSEGLSLY